MKKLHKTPLAAAMGAAVISSFSVPAANAEANPFGMTELSSGYMQVAEAGKTGEMACGASMKMDTPTDKTVEGACAGAKPTEAKPAEGKCGEGQCGAMMEGGKMKKGMESACGAMMKGKEGACGNMGQTAKEAKCAEGQCGAMMKGKEGACAANKAAPEVPATPAAKPEVQAPAKE